jgi:thiol-disulfide isomerase/thioredoxin
MTAHRNRPSSTPGLASVFAAIFLVAALSYSRAEDTNAPPTNGDKAWKEVERALQPPPLPAEWSGQRPTPEQVEKFRAEQGRLAGVAADKAKEFYTRFPDHAKATTARQKHQEMLQVAVRLGETSKAADLEKIEAEKLKDPDLSEDERFKLRMQSVQRTLSAKRGGDEGEFTAELEKSARALIKEFPNREEGYRLLLSAAQNGDEAKARALAKEIIASNDAGEVNASAEGLLRKLDALGKPLDIKFTALDGREVDVSKMKGKVVLIDFWATWCGPCVAEIPNVKKAYDKLHPKGFEIVGISFDDDKEKLQRFVSKEEMPWPQFSDGKGWGNKFGQQYGINSIPTMWLVDNKGNLREMNARDGLDAKVEKLLAE